MTDQPAAAAAERPAAAHQQPHLRQAQPSYGQPPSPCPQQDEKTWATLVHLAPFLAAVVGIAASSAR